MVSEDAQLMRELLSSKGRSLLIEKFEAEIAFKTNQLIERDEADFKDIKFNRYDVISAERLNMLMFKTYPEWIIEYSEKPMELDPSHGNVLDMFF